MLEQKKRCGLLVPYYTQHIVSPGPSRKGCVVNDQNTIRHATKDYASPPPTQNTRAAHRRCGRQTITILPTLHHGGVGAHQSRKTHFRTRKGLCCLSAIDEKTARPTLRFERAHWRRPPSLSQKRWQAPRARLNAQCQLLTLRRIPHSPRRQALTSQPIK